jgi:small GTP-binding protein
MIVSYIERKFPIKREDCIFSGFAPTLRIDNRTIHWVLFDTNGDDDYKRLRPITYTDTDIFIICFELSDSLSFIDYIKKWKDEISIHVPNAPFMIVATKSEIRDDKKMMKEFDDAGEEIKSIEWYNEESKKIGAEAYIECSAKNLKNLTEVFNESIRIAIKHKTSSKITKSKGCIIS